MPDLVAIDLPGGADVVDEVRRAWDAGDAVLPLDRRLPPAARDEVLRLLRPTVLRDETGRHRLDGDPVLAGDALVVATSGTTGTPKGVVLTRDALAAAARACHGRIGLTPGDRWLACLPLNHVGGFGVVARAIVDEVDLEVHDGFDAGRVIAAASAGATLVSLVPTALQRVDPALFRIVLLGGARPPRDRPANCIATYGMTETAGGVVYDGAPLDGTEVRVDADGGIHLRGPTLLRAYRGTDLAPPVVDGWLDTGDVGRWEPDGRLHVEGRRGEMIITGGENVWPEAVERALADHPAIADVAVLGVDDPEWGQRVTALVVPRSGAAPTVGDVRSFLADHLPAFMAPKQVVLTTAIPRTALGKIARAALPDLLAAAD